MSSSAAPRTATSSLTRSWTRRVTLPARVSTGAGLRDTSAIVGRSRSGSVLLTSTVDCQSDPTWDCAQGDCSLKLRKLCAQSFADTSLTRQVPGSAPRGTRRLPSQVTGSADGLSRRNWVADPERSRNSTDSFTERTPDGATPAAARSTTCTRTPTAADPAVTSTELDVRDSDMTCGGTVSRAHPATDADDGVTEPDAARPGASRSSETDSTSRGRERKVMTSHQAGALQRLLTPPRTSPPCRGFSQTTRRSAVSSPGESPVLGVSVGDMRTTSAPPSDTGWWCTPRGMT